MICSCEQHTCAHFLTTCWEGWDTACSSKQWPLILSSEYSSVYFVLRSVRTCGHNTVAHHDDHYHHSSCPCCILNSTFQQERKEKIRETSIDNKMANFLSCDKYRYGKRLYQFKPDSLPGRGERLGFLPSNPLCDTQSESESSKLPYASSSRRLENGNYST